MKEHAIDFAKLVLTISVGILIANAAQAYMDKQSILKPKS